MQTMVLLAPKSGFSVGPRRLWLLGVRSCLRCCLPCVRAGHGGGDQRLLDDIFIGGMHDPLMRCAAVQGCSLDHQPP